MFPVDLQTVTKALSRFAQQKFGLTLITVTAGILLIGQTRPTKTIEAECFVLRGADGSVRAKPEAAKDSTEFAFYNNAGKVRIAIKVASDGNGFEMRDDTARLLATRKCGAGT